MMNIYLVKGRVKKTEYEGEAEWFEEIRLVKANSIEEAEQKYEAYWEAKDVDYGHYYSVWGEVLEIVE
jgi:hypothetical protein